MLLGLNLLVTMAIEGKLLLIFIPFVNIFVVLFYIIVSVKNMIVPLNSYERSKIRTGKRIHKESAPMMKRKKEIEAELRSISA